MLAMILGFLLKLKRKTCGSGVIFLLMLVCVNLGLC